MKFLQKPPISVAALSFIIVFIELSLIRFLPAHILYLGFFSNFIIIAVFAGMGLGFLLAKKGFNLWIFTPFLLFLLVAGAKLLSLSLITETSDVIFFRGPDPPKTLLPAQFVLPVLFLLLTLLFTTISVPLGRLFAQSKNSIQTYAWDIGGAIAAVLLFSIFSFLGLPPAVWFALLGIVFLLTLPLSPTFLLVSLVLFFLTVIFSFDFDKDKIFWSPYYKINLSFNEKIHQGRVYTNNILHQVFQRNNDFSFYTEIFRYLIKIKPSDKILIIGAGTGQDVAAALSEKANAVDAVEIDPKIFEIGKNYHPDRPYSNPKVRTIIDDGRSFLEKTDKTYDVVIYALTDSLSLSSGKIIGEKEVRLESFLFTVEAFQKVKERLKAGGIFTLYNDYRNEWLIERLGFMLSSVFGGNAVEEINTGGASRVFLARKSQTTESNNFNYNQKLPTDDWPFFYIKSASIPPFYLRILGIIFLPFIAIFGLVVRSAKGLLNLSIRSAVVFFLLGAAFSLLETKSIVELSLVFGNTWIVNSIAFVGILFSVLFACIVGLARKLDSKLLGLLLIFALALNFLIPVSSLSKVELPLRLLVAIVYFYSPIFFANLLFTALIKDSQFPQIKLAANFLGLVVGGVLEYLSLITGFRNLTIVILLLYAVAVYLLIYPKHYKYESCA